MQARRDRRARSGLLIAVCLAPSAAAACGCRGDEDLVGPRVAAPPLERPDLVAFRASGRETVRYDLVRARANGKGVRVLPGGSERDSRRPALFERVAWSPDGRRLALTAEFGYPPGFARGRDIYVMRADGSGRRRLTFDGVSFHPVWSPDGRRIYFARQPKRHPAEVTLPDGRRRAPTWIWSIRPDGSDRRAITSPVEARFDIPGSFSPDGATLAFTRGTYVGLDDGREHNTRGVWVMRPDGAEARQLAERSRDPVFSPEGRRIAFVSDRDENGDLNYGDRSSFANELYVMDADGSRPRRLTRTRARNELQPSWLPNGKRIAYQRGRQYQNAEVTVVMQANPDGSCAKQIFTDASPFRWYAAPAWRPGDARRGDATLRC